MNSVSSTTARPLGLASAGRPLLDGIDEPVSSADALDDRPAVVAAGDDDVQLVPGVLPELAGEHRPVGRPGEALDVAMPEL